MTRVMYWRPSTPAVPAGRSGAGTRAGLAARPVRVAARIDAGGSGLALWVPGSPRRGWGWAGGLGALPALAEGPRDAVRLVLAAARAGLAGRQGLAEGGLLGRRRVPPGLGQAGVIQVGHPALRSIRRRRICAMTGWLPGRSPAARSWRRLSSPAGAA